MKLFLFCLLAPLPTFAFTPTQKLEDLHQLKQIIENDYAPLPMKERQGIHLNSLIKEYEARLTTASDEDFPYTLIQFLAEFRDSHFTAKGSSPRKLQLGFSTDLVDGKVLIDEIRLTPLEFPFSRGDEVATFNGRPVAEEIDKLESYFGMGRAITARNLATYFLAIRQERQVPLPQGFAELGIRRRGQAEITSITLPWKEKTHTPTSQQQTQFPIGASDWCSEKSRIKPPADAKIFSFGPFTAFSFPSPKGRVGFLRIPHYFPLNSEQKEIAAQRFAEYEKTVAEFEKETVGLIIDQDYNCGGSILYVNKLLTLFAREPFLPASFQFRASEGQVEGLSKQLANFSPVTEGYPDLKSTIDEIRASKNAGEYFSRRIPIKGIMEVQLSLPGEKEILPNVIRYTKPIVLLINEMSGSGGDLFPAMMQDLHLAKLMGTTTMGAGGHVWDDPKLVLRHSGLQINPTRSLIYRLNGELIENNGVTPDVEYPIGEKDFLNGFQDYLQTAVQNLQL